MLPNRARAGISANFERVFRAAGGELIFPSDCDDVWYPEKLERMLRLFTECPGAGVATCNADMVDGNLRPLGKTEWEHFRFQPGKSATASLATGQSFNARLPVLGHSMAFRNSLRSVFLPFPESEVFYRGWWDYFIGWTVLCSGSAGIAVTSEPLVAWRRHSQSATAVPRDENRLHSTLQRWRSRGQRGLAALPAVVERLESLRDVEVPNPRIRSEAIVHWRARCTLPPSTAGRFATVVKELVHGRYHRFSQGLRTAARDLFLVA